MLTSRERVNLALSHQEADRIPVDLGGSLATGMHVSIVYRLRQALGLDSPGTPVRMIEPYQMLGEIAPDLMEALGTDVVNLPGFRNFFGYANEGWKPWTFFDGIPMLVPEGFNTEPEPNGDVLMYPEGDRSAPPSGRMPKGGFFFDTIVRQPPLDESNPKLEDNLEEFGPISTAELEHLKQETERLHAETDKAIFAGFYGTAFGDIALVPAPWMKYPKGVRDIEAWYVVTATNPDFVREIFERQTQIALANLAKIHTAVGDRIAAVWTSGSDFGMQNGPFISPKAYRHLYRPYQRRINDWIHQHTSWKSLVHSCGSVRLLLDDFAAAGFDVLNPVQCSAARMDPAELKTEFGSRFTFWGGGVDTQRTLPFGTPDDVRREVRERIRIFGPGGGFVFAAVHNIQARTPVENLLAMFETVREYGRYPCKA
jgi:hypothetical protein